MKKLIYFLLFTCLFSCQRDDCNIEFRIQNNLGESISRCYLGARIFKGSDSYMTKSYAVKWTELADGELTNYKSTKGKFWGYSKCSLEFYGENSKYPHQTHIGAIDTAIAKLNIQLIADSIEHPYTEEMIYNNRLPDGKYTLTIEGFHPTISQTILVSITKDE